VPASGSRAARLTGLAFSTERNILQSRECTIASAAADALAPRQRHPIAAGGCRVSRHLAREGGSRL